MEINLQEVLNTALVAGVGLCTYYVWKIKNEVIASKEEVIKDMKSFKEIFKVDEFEKFVTMSINRREMEHEALLKEVELKYQKTLIEKENEHMQNTCEAMFSIFSTFRGPMKELAKSKLKTEEEYMVAMQEYEKLISSLEEGAKDPDKARQFFS